MAASTLASRVRLRPIWAPLEGIFAFFLRRSRRPVEGSRARAIGQGPLLAHLGSVARCNWSPDTIYKQTESDWKAEHAASCPGDHQHDPPSW